MNADSLFQKLLDAAPVGFCCFDDSLRYVFVNKTLADINGLTVENHIGRTVTEVIPKMGFMIQNILEQVLTTGTSVLNVQVSGETAAAPLHIRQWLASYHPVTGEHGKIYRICAYVREVTEFKHAEDSLLETEARFQEILDHTPCQVFAKTLDGRCYLYNKACERIWGLPRTSVIGKTPGELFPSSVADRMATNHATVLSEGKACALSESLPTPLGDRDFASVLFPLRNTAGDITGVGGMCLDVTEQRVLEKRMLVYQHIVSSADDAICMVGPDYTYKEANDSYLRYCGQTKQNLIGRLVSEVLGQEYFISTLKSRFDCALAGETVQFENWVNYPNRERCYFLVSYTPCRDEEGQVIGVVVIARDVTERVYAEERLRQSEEKFRIIADYTADWESWIDRDGRLLWVNPVVEDFTGYSLVECMEMPDYPFSLIHQDDRDTLRHAITRGLAGERGNDLPLRIVGRTGETRWATISWNPIMSEEDGIVASLRISVRDISERKRISETLEEKANELTKINIALQFLLDQRERDRLKLQEKIAYNIVHLVDPYLNQIILSDPNSAVKCYVDIIKKNLEDFFSPLAKILDAKYGSLTGNEIRVANLIRQGKSSKDIAQLLSVSLHTISYYRNSIRRKLGISGNKRNLRTVLDVLTGQADMEEA